MRNLKRVNPVVVVGRGFTLVEMLVSVALVLVVLTILSTVLSLATRTIASQTAIANNDQKARSLVTLIRRDVAKRSMENVYPFYPSEDPANPQIPVPFDSRRGYLYISTNAGSDYQDDLIQFSVDAGLFGENEDETKFRGAATLLIDALQSNQTLVANPNQPEADDAKADTNGVAESDTAEVMYFLRNGNLYRRVSLLREPLEVLSLYGASDQPTSGPQGMMNPFFQDNPTGGTYNGSVDDFWRDFDFSAVPINSVTATDLNNPTSLSFLTALDLDNSAAAGSLLAEPQNRFGFNPMTGLSREHSDDTSLQFLGRYVHAETSHTEFDWPLAPSLNTAPHNGNPMDLTGFPVTLVPRSAVSSAADVVSEFAGAGRGGVRRMEDLVLSNVHEFRVEIWDEALGRFVVPGYGNRAGDAAAAIGDFHIARNLQYDTVSTAFQYGPLAALATPPDPAVFDTWHPEVAIDFDGDTNLTISEVQPPYLPYRYNPPTQIQTPPGPSSPLAPNGDATYWQAATAYAAGDVVFAWDGTAASGWDANGDAAFQWDLDAAAIPNQAFQLAYLCTTGGTSDAAPPAWSETVGASVPETGGSTVVWQVIENFKPLKAIRMIIRFEDTPSGQIRQLTIALSLTER